MNKIHPLACVSPNAKLGDNIEIGPYAFIDDDVEIGDGCKIHPHAVIYKYVKMGSGCEVFPGAVIGAIPQDLKFEGEVTYVEIGNDVTIRECATINRGTKASGKGVTRVGDNTLVMSYVHIAHDCNVGRHCILVSHTGIAGETDLDDWAILGGGTLVHQFTKIGTHAMISGGSRLNKDIPPFSICGREPICYCGVNIVGLRRRGFSSDAIRNIIRSELLRRTEAWRASPPFRGPRAFMGDSEIYETHLAFRRNHDVAGLDVPMHHRRLSAMQVFEHIA